MARMFVRLTVRLLACLSNACAAAVAWCVSWFVRAKSYRGTAAAVRRYRRELKAAKEGSEDWREQYETAQAKSERLAAEIEMLKIQLNSYAEFERKTLERQAAETAEYAARKVAAMGGVQHDREEL
jgi:uncharacterized protein YlxW (UPF0749 family)